MKVFREKLNMMVDLLHPSVVRFPSTLAANDIHLDDATKDQAINPKPVADMTTKVFSIVKTSVKRNPEECFKKFIQCLLDADCGFFDSIIDDLGQCTNDNVFQCVNTCCSENLEPECVNL